MNTYSDFLFARPSFLEGAARVLDLCGTLDQYNESVTPEQADTIALRADWAAIGLDLWEAIDAAEQDPEQRRESARKAARARWSKTD